MMPLAELFANNIRVAEDLDPEEEKILKQIFFQGASSVLAEIGMAKFNKFTPEEVSSGLTAWVVEIKEFMGDAYVAR